MKKYLAILASVAVFGVFANAQDKGTEFKFGGEMLQRFDNNQAANLGAGGSAATTSSFLSKNQFHVNAISSDKLQAYFDFLHTAVWGGATTIPSNNQPYSNGVTASTPNNGATSVQNALQVSEAWLWWKISDMASLRSGRQALSYGDGLVFSKNDWLATPYNAEGAMARLSWDFLDLDFGGGVLGDVGPGVVGGNTDAQNIFYGLYASFKSMPDVLKTGELFVLQDNEDAAMGPSSFLPSLSTLGTGGSFGLTAIGIHLKGAASIVDYRLDGVYETGKQKAGLAQANDITYAANMIDAEVGANFPEFMKGRVALMYHRDTGDDSTDRTQQHQYQPLFYDRHAYGGMMNTVGFGNLSEIRVVAQLSPTEDTTFGVDLSLLNRTSAVNTSGSNYSPTNWLTAAEGNMFGNASPAGQNQYGNAGNTNGSSTSLGTQYGLWAKHDYGHGFSMYAQLAYFSLGSYFTGSGIQTTNPMQLVAQAKYQF
jgi:hypothetical protein